MNDSLSTLTDLLTERRFLTGAVLGALGLVALLVVKRVRTPALWAFVVAVATLVGIQHVDHVQVGVLVGVGLMAAGGVLIGGGSLSVPTSQRQWAGWVVVVAGAVVVALQRPTGSAPWFVPATALAAIVLGALLSRWGDVPEGPLLGPLFAITAFGVWTTVPDTEFSQVLLGVAVVMCVGTLRPIGATVTSGGSFALAGTFAWLTMIGGAGRPASIVGAWACIGMIAVIPLVRHWWPDHSAFTAWQVVAVQVAMVLVAARVIGLWTWAVPAVVAAGGLFLVAIIGVRRLGTTGDAAGDR
jgi:hypothetical protein